MNRGDVRATYNLTGNGCKDCLCACCCAPCDLIQQDKEVEHREELGRPLLDQPGKVEGWIMCRNGSSNSRNSTTTEDSKFGRIFVRSHFFYITSFLLYVSDYLRLSLDCPVYF